MDEVKQKDKADVETYDFQCCMCELAIVAHYKGRTPPFSRNIDLKYPSYVMKDPFSPPGKGEILVLGADCAICNKSVCINKKCSVFYVQTYCMSCVCNSVDKFPIEITSKLPK